MTDAELLAALERERYGDPVAFALEAWPPRRRPRIATVHQLVPAAAAPASTPAAPAWVRSA